MHTSSAAANWPPAQLLHTRAEDVVASADQYVPASHSPLASKHSAPLSTSEYREPRTQAAHWRSAMAVPSTDMPWPAGHVDHAAHAALPVVALKVPAAHAEQTRSQSAPEADDSYLPAAHTVNAAQTRSLARLGDADTYSSTVQVVSAWHAVPSFTFEYVESTTQAAHWRSAVAVPATDWPSLEGHVAHATHELPSLKKPV